jgi:hypothetical protein
MLSHQTTMKYGTAEQAQEAQQYLVSNFSSSALAIEEEEMEEAFEGNDARRLERLQARTSRLMDGNHRPVRDSASASDTSRSSHRGRRHQRYSRMDVDTCITGTIREKRPRDESQELTRRVRRNRDRDE